MSVCVRMSVCIYVCEFVCLCEHIFRVKTICKIYLLPLSIKKEALAQLCPTTPQIEALSVQTTKVHHTPMVSLPGPIF